MGTVYGIGKIGKIIGPLGLALIVGSSDVISPKATIAAIEPAMIYLAAWYALSGIVFYCWASKPGAGRSKNSTLR